MTMTDLPVPERLRATAATWSLRQALTLLDNREAAEARAIATELAAAADTLRSPVYGSRQVTGGHGDPTIDALLALDAPARTNPWTPLVAEVHGQLAGVALHLPPAGHDPLGRIAAAIPAMSTPAAAATWTLLDRIDARIRRLLHEPPDRQHIPRVRCPWCDAVDLSMRLAPPRPQRVAECGTCTGAWLWTKMTGVQV